MKIKNVVKMVGVYRWDQDITTQPSRSITLAEADYWITLGVAHRCIGRRHGGITIRLVRITRDMFQRCSSLGVGLTWAYLAGLEEAIESVHSHRSVAAEIVRAPAAALDQQDWTAYL